MCTIAKGEECDHRFVTSKDAAMLRLSLVNAARARSDVSCNLTSFVCSRVRTSVRIAQPGASALAVAAGVETDRLKVEVG